MPSLPIEFTPAIQVAAIDFDRDFFSLPEEIRSRIDNKIDNMGSRLVDFPHYRMRGTELFRLRVGDYRIIYSFDLEKNTIDLLAVGHRREVYQSR